MNSHSIPQHYQVAPLLFAGEYPFDETAETGREKLAALVAGGVETFLDLTELVDPLEPYAEALAGLAAEAGRDLRYFRHPIRDMSIPVSSDIMSAIQERIRNEMAAGRTVYVHCWGGIGRTGTAIGVWFREQGLSGEEALETVQRLYSTMPKVRWHPRSPQTRDQRAYVEEWTAPARA